MFVHTEVLPAFEGKGVGSRLATWALDDVRARGLKLTPQCPFIAAFIKRHPAYADLVVGVRGTPVPNAAPTPATPRRPRPALTASNPIAQTQRFGSAQQLCGLLEQRDW